MKAPYERIQFCLASFLIIKLADQRQTTKAKIEKRLKPEGSELEDIKIETIQHEHEQVETEIKVMVLGKLENARIQCLRELHCQETDCDSVPIGVKQNLA